MTSTINYQIPITGVLSENDNVITEESQQPLCSKKLKKENIIWSNIFYQVLFHIFAICGFYLLFTSMKLVTIIYGFTLYQVGIVGVMAGTHRLWCHRSYKAKWPLRLLFIIFTTIAYQKSTLEWARDHRVHHKHSETDADPYNAKRGFFFSHIGWTFVKRDPEVITKGKSIDNSDLFADPFVRFQHMNYWILPVCSYILPVLIPIYFWKETFFNAFCMNWLRYALCLHASFSINSLAHMYGNRPYDRYIEPRQNTFVAVVAGGEGWHNYHHTFPWDYRAAEFGKWNVAYHFINFFAKIGWAYDLKTVSKDVVNKRMERTGERTKNERTY